MSMRGPAGHPNKNQIEKMARRLINDQTTSICRNTGIQLHGDISDDDDDIPPNVAAAAAT